MMLLLFSGASADASATTAPISLTGGERDTALSLENKATKINQSGRDTAFSLQEER